MTISAVILTKNEEANIKDCLESLKFCDEIIVVDDDSIDKTRQIARKHGAKVYRRNLGGNFADQRNFSLSKTRGKWVFFVDADERVTPALRSEIIQLINNPIIHYSGFYVKRHDFMWGKQLAHGETGGIKLLRLAKEKAGRWKRKVHEEWVVEERTGELKNPLLHYPHPSLREFIESVNTMSSFHGEANRKEGKRASLFKIIAWPSGKFVLNWLFKLGFLDGIQGLMVALMMSFHSFLSWGKLWLWQKKH
jgi:glycosyltransferase involved in cell wall biosynthesis